MSPTGDGTAILFSLSFEPHEGKTVCKEKAVPLLSIASALMIDQNQRP